MLNRVILAAAAAALAAPAARAADWPQWMGPNRDGVWAETGVLDKFPEGGPKVLWRVPVAGGYAGPAVAGGKVYVHDYDAPGDKTPDPGKRNELKGVERVLCLNAADGKQLWKHEYPCEYKVSYPCGPRCTPTVAGGKVYTLGSMGDLYCLDAETGKAVWSKDFKAAYKAPVPIWGFTGHPLVDGRKLICLVGGEGSVAVAFDKDTGKELWKAVSAKEQGYCPPTIIRAGGARQLLIWDAEKLNSLDPETGKAYWSVPLEPNYGMSIMAPRQAGDLLFAGAIGFKSALLKLAADRPAAEVVWRGKKDTSVYPVNSTPIVDDGVMYAVDQPGQLRAVRLATGERLWETFKPVIGQEKPANFRGAGSGTAFLVKNGDRYLLMAETGHLVVAKLTPKGYEEVSRAKILDATGTAFGRDVVWSHPAFADKCCFARNDKEVVCVSLAK